MTDGGCAHYHRAIRYGFCDGAEFFGFRQHFRRPHSRSRLAKGNLVGVNDPEAEDSEIAHGTGCGPDIERVPRIHQHNAKMIQRVFHSAQPFYDG